MTNSSDILSRRLIFVETMTRAWTNLLPSPLPSSSDLLEFLLRPLSKCLLAFMTDPTGLCATSFNQRLPASNILSRD